MISTEFPPMRGGIAAFAGNLAKGLAEQGFRVHVLTAASNDSSQGEGSVGPMVTRCPRLLSGRLVRFLPLFFAATASALSKRPHFVLAMSWTHDGVVALGLRRLLRLTYAVVAHGSEVTLYRRGIRGLLMRRVFRGADVLLANSSFTRQLLRSVGVAAEKIQIVNPPIRIEALKGKGDASRADARFNLAGKRVLLTVGRMVRRKGHTEVIRVLGKIKDFYPDLVYVSTGEGGYRRHLEQLARAEAVADCVRLVGFVDDQALVDLYARAEIYVSPSCDDNGDVEGFGVALLEASASGLPVIAGKSGGAPEVVLDGATGMLVEPFDTSDLEQKLRRLLDDVDLRAQLGEAGARRAEAKFSAEIQLKRLIALLERRGDC